MGRAGGRRRSSEWTWGCVAGGLCRDVYRAWRVAKEKEGGLMGSIKDLKKRMRARPSFEKVIYANLAAPFVASVTFHGVGAKTAAKSNLAFGHDTC